MMKRSPGSGGGRGSSQSGSRGISSSIRTRPAKSSEISGASSGVVMSSFAPESESIRFRRSGG